MELEFSAQLRGHELNFKTTWGIFSPKAIDAGTQMLLEDIQLPEASTVLDLGCGYGPIGITLAKEAAEVHMVDKDFVAVDYANMNAKLNGCDKAQAYLSNAFSQVPQDLRFDCIVSNIPAKVGKEMLLHMLQEAHTRLKPKGQLYVVTIAGLKEFMKRNMKEIFGNYKKLSHGKGYVVALTQKQ